MPEANETFAVNLSAARSATIGDGHGICTIPDDEPRITVGDVRMAEGRKGNTTLFTFWVTLSPPYDQPVTVSFRTMDGVHLLVDGCAGEVLVNPSPSEVARFSELKREFDRSATAATAAEALTRLVFAQYG